MTSYWINYTTPSGAKDIYGPVMADSESEAKSIVEARRIPQMNDWVNWNVSTNASQATQKQTEEGRSYTYYDIEGNAVNSPSMTKSQADTWAKNQDYTETKPSVEWNTYYDPQTGEQKRIWGTKGTADQIAGQYGYTTRSEPESVGGYKILYNSQGNRVEVGPNDEAEAKARGYTLASPPIQSSGRETPSPEESLLSQVLEQLKTNLAQMNKNGQIINPGLDFNSPEGKAKVAEFLAKAEGEINPYYAGQLKLARDTLYKDLRYSTDEINLLEESYAKKYKTAHRDLGEQMAEKGLAYSGTRKLGEEELASTFGESLSAQRRATQRAAESQAGQFAQQWGTRELPTDFNVPLTSFGAGTITRQGQQPLYTLSQDIYKDLIGEQEWGRQTAVKTRASELEGAFRTQEQINELRKLL